MPKKKEPLPKPIYPPIPEGFIFPDDLDNPIYFTPVTKESFDGERLDPAKYDDEMRFDRLNKKGKAPD